MAAKPIRLTNPTLLLGASDVTCFARRIKLAPEEDSALATFCDPNGYAWVMAIDFLVSFGAESLDAALTAAGLPGTVVAFDFSYTEEVASATNPHWTGEVRLTPIPIVDAGINEPTEFTMEMDVVGEPLKVLA